LIFYLFHDLRICRFSAFAVRLACANCVICEICAICVSVYIFILTLSLLVKDGRF